MCCKQLKLEIDTLVGLNIELRRPIKSTQLLEWIQSLRINEINVRVENITAWELMIFLENRMCLKSVHIWNPEDFELIPALTMLSALDNLRVLCIDHTCGDHLGILPISVYRFARLQRLHIFLHFDEISFDTAHVFQNVRCPQLQDLSLSFSFESPYESSNFVNQKVHQKYFQLLLNMIEIFPSIRVLLVDFFFDNFTPLYISECKNLGKLINYSSA